MASAKIENRWIYFDFGLFIHMNAAISDVIISGIQFTVNTDGWTCNRIMSRISPPANADKKAQIKRFTVPSWTRMAFSAPCIPHDAIPARYITLSIVAIIMTAPFKIYYIKSIALVFRRYNANLRKFLKSSDNYGQLWTKVVLFEK